MKVIITRPDSSASQWEHRLNLLQIDTIKLPLIDIKKIADEHFSLAYQKALLQAYDALMFVSPNAVHYFFNRVAGQEYVKKNAGLRFWANGPGTMLALQEHGIVIEKIDGPSEKQSTKFDSESLWSLLKLSGQLKSVRRVLILRGQSEGVAEELGKGNGRNWLADQLTSVGIVVDFLAVYCRCLPVWTNEQKVAALAACQNKCIWLFTSSEGVKNLPWLMPNLSFTHGVAVATHPNIALAARAIGFGMVDIASPLLAQVVLRILEVAKKFE